MPDVPRSILFTDLDGTLLGRDDYRPGPALEALWRLREHGVVVLPVTSKTAAELGPIAAELGLHDGWIVENGAAVHGPTEASPLARVLPEMTTFGVPSRRVREGLAAAAEAAGATVHGFGDMDSEEVAARTGLPLDAARAARWRDWSETFLLLDGDAGALAEQLRRRGLRMVQGGRFLTASGPHDKGTAVRSVLSRWAAVSWGVGDAANDVPMLAEVDHPCQVRSVDGTWAQLDVPGVTRLSGIGPEGFVQAAGILLDRIGRATTAVAPR